MDRAHRLGQTKQVTVYRLICKGTIEERILQRAREKSEIQRMVISGGNFKPDTLKPKEVVSLLLDDEEIETKYRQKVENNSLDVVASTSTKDQSSANDKRKRQATKLSTATNQPTGGTTIPATPTNANTSKASSSGGGNTSNAGSTEDSEIISPCGKRIKLEITSNTLDDDSIDVAVSETSSTSLQVSTTETSVLGGQLQTTNEDSENEALMVDCESPMQQQQPGNESPTFFDDCLGPIRRRHHPRGTKRGRPRGSTRRGGGNGSSSTRISTSPGQASVSSNNEDASTVALEPPLTITGEDIFTPTAVPTPVKRGPGRPRIKTGGPVNQGVRGAPRTRKPIGPLVVPLGSSPAATPINRSPAMSPAPSPAHSERNSISSSSGIGGGGALYYQPSSESLD